MSKEELTSYGYVFSNRKARLQCLRETIQILEGLWTSHDFSFNGKLFQLSHARLEPKPVQIPHPPLWIGGKDFGLLDVVAEFADGWNYWNLIPNEALDRIDYLRSKCSNWHPFSNIVKSYSVALRPDQSDEEILTHLKTQAALSTDYFIAYFGPDTKQDTLQLFADLARKL
jgi:alkanesulfonate monooxygenase SsuD/methylene tetrahydromethanopterin reductase-like flavin-dependent oxidoreductase (luciferase family)